MSSKTYSYGNTVWKDLLTGYDGATLSYDGIGNLTDDGTWSYTWEHGRQLAGMSKTGTAVSFGYDADGLRVSKTVSGTTTKYYYTGSQLTDLKKGSDTLHFTYDVLGPATVTYNGTVYYYLRNAQGDITGIVNVSGSEVVSYSYDAWGDPTDVSGSMTATLGALNPFRYRGYVYDEETELYYLKSRYYKPAWGRFINADSPAVPTISPDSATWDKNLFAYCDNNPVNRKDGGGQFWNVVVGALIGAAINTVTTILSARSAGAPIDGKDILISALSGAASGAFAATGIGCIGQALANGTIGYIASAANDEIHGREVNRKKAYIAFGAGFVSGLIGGKGIRHKKGLLVDAANKLETVTKAAENGMKFAGTTAKKAVLSATRYYEETYAIQSLITTGRFFAGSAIGNSITAWTTNLVT